MMSPSLVVQFHHSEYEVSQHMNKACFQETYHNTGANSDTSPAICVWHNVTKTNGEECYCN